MTLYMYVFKDKVILLKRCGVHLYIGRKRVLLICQVLLI